MPDLVDLGSLAANDAPNKLVEGKKKKREREIQMTDRCDYAYVRLSRACSLLNSMTNKKKNPPQMKHWAPLKFCGI